MRVTSTLDGISLIVSVGSEPQMCRVYAYRAITRMQNLKTVSYWAVMNQI